MKLVELLARELEIWPEEANFIAQDYDKCAHPYSKIGPCDGMQWGGNVESSSYSVWMPELADDHSTAIITRADWEAERARIKGEKAMPKANKDGWIRHRGGKCPVADDAQVDLKLRNGEIMCPASRQASKWNWRHSECPAKSRQITAWRPHKAEQATTEQSSDVEMPAAKYFDGPLQWRDRIHTIDFNKAAAQKAHEAAMLALDNERAELVAKLRAEGLALVGREDQAQHVELTDWRQWHIGDLVTVLDNEGELDLVVGRQYPIVHLESDDYEEDMPAQLKNNDCRWLDFANMKWHSRPSK